MFPTCLSFCSVGPGNVEVRHGVSSFVQQIFVKALRVPETVLDAGNIVIKKQQQQNTKKCINQFGVSHFRLTR